MFCGFKLDKINYHLIFLKSNSPVGRKGAESRDISTSLSLKSPAHALLADTKNKNNKNMGKKSADLGNNQSGATVVGNTTMVIQIITINEELINKTFKNEFVFRKVNLVKRCPKQRKIYEKVIF